MGFDLGRWVKRDMVKGVFIAQIARAILLAHVMGWEENMLKYLGN